MADTIYVDADLSSDCTSGNYSIASRNCSGSDGDAYADLSDAIDAMSGGDTLQIREPTSGDAYEEAGGISGWCSDIPSGSQGSPTVIRNHSGETPRISPAQFQGLWCVIHAGQDYISFIGGLDGPTYNETTDEWEITDGGDGWLRITCDKGGAVYQCQYMIQLEDAAGADLPTNIIFSGVEIDSTDANNENGGGAGIAIDAANIDVDITIEKSWFHDIGTSRTQVGERWHHPIYCDRLQDNSDGAGGIIIQDNLIEDSPAYGISETCGDGDNPTIIRRNVLRNLGNELDVVRGGGIFGPSASKIYNNFIIDNVGYGIFCGTALRCSNSHIAHNTISGNGAEGIEPASNTPATAEIENNLLTGNSGDQIGGDGNPTLDGNVTDANSTGHYQDFANEDYRITLGSPARDSSTEIAEVSADFFGNNREADADAGAHEIQTGVQCPEQACYVDPDNGDDMNDGTQAEPLATIATALAAIDCGGEIILIAGAAAYDEGDLAMPTGCTEGNEITIRPNPGDTVTIQPSAMTSATNIFVYTNADFISLSGGVGPALILDGTNLSGYVIDIDADSHNNSVRVGIENAAAGGIQVGGDNTLIHNMSVDGSGGLAIEVEPGADDTIIQDTEFGLPVLNGEAAP